MKWFKHSEAVETRQYKVVEVPAPRTPLQVGREVNESVATLASHPGFVALLTRLDLQNSALRSKLTNERHADMRSVDFLQAGVYWSEWLKNELRRATTKLTTLPKPAMDEELEAFREIDAQIERIG